MPCNWLQFFITKSLSKLISTKQRIFIVGRPSETGESQIIYNWVENGIFREVFDKIFTFFHQHWQPFYNVFYKELEKLEVVRGVHFEFTDSLKHNGTKNLLILRIHVKRVAIQKRSLIIKLLEGIVD